MSSNTSVQALTRNLAVFQTTYNEYAVADAENEVAQTEAGAANKALNTALGTLVKAKESLEASKTKLGVLKTQNSTLVQKQQEDEHKVAVMQQQLTQNQSKLDELARRKALLLERKQALQNPVSGSAIKA